jgi:hypothetical protein
MKRSPVFLLAFLYLFGFSLEAQTKFDFSNGFNVLKDMNADYKNVMKNIGKANKIEKDYIDQLFCGMTRGQDIHFLYTTFGVNISARKQLGYVSQKEIGRGIIIIKMHGLTMQ